MGEEDGVSKVSEARWRNRFILVNLVTIGGTVLVLASLVLWQTDLIVEGGSAIGMPLALLGVAISFFAPRLMASRWKRHDSR